MRSLSLLTLCTGLLWTNVYAADNQYNTQPTTTTTNQVQPQTQPTTTTDQVQPQAMDPVAMKNKTESEAFLALNKTKPGVVTLPSGLQYRIITDGSGAKPTIKDTVTVHYTGSLINGTEFDSSYRRGQPVSFPVNAVIPGWVEALQLMRVGSTWELYIPPQLAYGEQGMPPLIGPNQALIFKVTLVGVNNNK